MRKLEPTDKERPATGPAEVEVKPSSGRLSKVSRLRGPLKTQPKFLVLPLKWLVKLLGWLVPRYLINAWRELKQVTWPSRRESWRLTGAVFIFAIIFGVLATIVDRSLDDIFKKTILK